MNEQEYRDAIETKKAEHLAELSRIHIEFAESNNPHKIGDIVTDHSGSIMIEKIRITFQQLIRNPLPMCIYRGPRLKKNGEPFKRPEDMDVYQSNLI